MDEREHHSNHSEHSSAHTHSTRRQRWREAKKRHKNAKKEYYRDAPLLVRMWKFWVKNVIIALLLVALAFFAFFRTGMYTRALNYYIERAKDNPVSKETIYMMSPPDDEGAARIDSMAPFGENDTWTVAIYMVGSNLEDNGENDLSYLTRVMTEPVKEKNSENDRNEYRESLDTFVGELESKGLTMPEYLYKPVKPVASSTTVTEDVIVSRVTGAASADISEITSGVWGDNITVVIQTGGATHWTNSMINPNKTQRFEYKNGVFSEVAELPLQDSCAPETLSDFMRFCDEEYPSDHRILILWDHGGGVRGFGRDSIFGSGFTLRELRRAFSNVYQPDFDEPAYDIIGFDACLMATAEVAHCLDGFGKYLVASEELESGFGWDYDAWLQEMSGDPTMNAAQVGRAITDSYVNSYMALNKNLGNVFGNMEVTMSVADMHGAAKTYDAYCELCAAQLKDAAGDLGVLADIGRKAGSVTRYGSSMYDRINSVDLGGYMDMLADTYPDESRKVRAQLCDAVLYHRQSEGLADSQGLAVYVPVETKKLNGLLDCISFVYDTGNNEYVKALYYYKIAGCLNLKMGRYTSILADREPMVLDTELFREIRYADPAIEEVGWSVSVDDALLNMIQDCTLELALYDEATGSLIYYGHGEFVEPDGEGSLVSSFEGKWIALDGVPLSTEIVSSSASTVSYRSRVRCDGEDYYLMFSYNRDSEEFRIAGLKKIETGDDTVLMLNSRKTETAIAGKTLVPIYECHSLITGEDMEKCGKKIYITTNSAIESLPLPDGEYLSTIVITDPRGDSYYSAVVEQKLMSGRIVIQEINTDFYGTD